MINNEQLKEYIKELMEFTSIPNNVYDPNQIRNNAEYLKSIMESKGITTELLDTHTNRPLVFGELSTPGAVQTILIYSHFDGVPVEEEEWYSPPYMPVLRKSLDGESMNLDDISINEFEDYRIFARSIADSKNSIIASLVALDILREENLFPKVNIKFLFDSEEEVESPSLKELLSLHWDKMKADLVISASGETHQSGLPTIELGFRGILQFNVSVYTGGVDLHSGHFGNYLPNAAFQLCTLISTMKDEKGMVAINNFYDDLIPMTKTEKEIINEIPKVENDINAKFGIQKPEINELSLQELINLPTLNVRGLSGGYVGENGRNIIPSHSTAEFDVRLVKGMDPEKTLHLIKAHIHEQGWTLMEEEPRLEDLLAFGKIAVVKQKAGFPATKASYGSKEAQYVINSLKEVFGDEIVIMPTEGGSLPLYIFENFNVPVIGIPTSNFDCNQHTHNENLRMDFFKRAIKTFRSLYTYEL
ncbi:M20/M25/M40 family metallo-hydrolase [Bacillus sp. FJAT-49736]|uniref:M20/M25/M40 family metallo-hydrolase n=1 Tax=Bacillus sp. FJAT-49736 TaxID=2833582 RepID=UPI001BCA52CF|nr:M20/M25/M40 family metallo-hydrolase [Bacillus sp. FJAT-49736]MBS4172238.1 M20/M25/M40 family metallo-hydrolase [Bacillus sp. FJAT-49736]